MTPSLLSAKEVPAALNEVLKEQFGDDYFSGFIFEKYSHFLRCIFEELSLFPTKNA